MMSDRDFSHAEVSRRAALAQRAEEEAPQTAVSPVLQRDPVDQVVCRAGDASCATAHAAALNRSAGLDRSPAGRSLLRLQRQYGNRYAREVLHRARETEGEGGASASLERSIEAARGGGQAVDSTARQRMEPSFGADFSGVRVHTDANADALNRSLNAKAFTTGQDIFFRKGAYNPGTSSGRELLAHELTHVVQQNGEKVQRKLTVSQPGDRHELEADQTARAVMDQEQRGTPQQSVARQDEKPEETAQTQPDATGLQRQPEAPKDKDEEERRRLSRAPESQWLARQTDEEQPE